MVREKEVGGGGRSRGRWSRRKGAIGLRGRRVQGWGAEGDWQRESNDGG